MADEQQQSKPKRGKAKKQDGRANNGGAREGAGQPRKDIDYAMLERAAGYNCNQEEIAACLGIAKETLRQIFQRDPSARELYERGNHKFKAMLRMAQAQSAIVDRNPAMLVFLGKNYLGQTNETVLQVTSGNTVKDTKEALPDWLKQSLQQALSAKEVVIDVTATDGATHHSPVNGGSMPTSGQNTRDSEVGLDASREKRF